MCSAYLPAWSTWRGIFLHIRYIFIWSKLFWQDALNISEWLWTCLSHLHFSQRCVLCAPCPSDLYKMHPWNNHGGVLENVQNGKKNTRVSLQTAPFLPTGMLNKQMKLHNRVVYNMPPAEMYMTYKKYAKNIQKQSTICFPVNVIVGKIRKQMVGKYPPYRDYTKWPQKGLQEYNLGYNNHGGYYCYCSCCCCYYYYYHHYHYHYYFYFHFFFFYYYYFFFYYYYFYFYFYCCCYYYYSYYYCCCCYYYYYWA